MPERAACLPATNVCKLNIYRDNTDICISLTFSLARIPCKSPFRLTYISRSMKEMHGKVAEINKLDLFHALCALFRNVYSICRFVFYVIDCAIQNNTFLLLSQINRDCIN